MATKKKKKLVSKKKTVKRKKAARKKATKKATKKAAPKAPSPKKIIGRGEPKPYQLFNGGARGVGLIICDHASSRIPASLKGLGLKKADVSRHIGWDIGAEEASKHLSKLLSYPAVLATYSRLVLDLNRAPKQKTIMPEKSDNIVIPGNQKLTAAAKSRRVKEIHTPYHAQVSAQVSKFTKAGQKPFLLFIHSFTPEMDGARRPWHISVLWNKHEKIAKALVFNLRRNHPEYLVGENEPYTLKDGSVSYSPVRHADGNDLPYIFVEFRQDLIDTKDKAKRWAEILAEALQPIIMTL